ncbi:cell division protein SepF [Halodesulfurarchaeum sp.]|uniref:cell division protein SepF n=1 Tax=Halodesulfurarchaeum sp. TaxID=1980530 RepID=UPI001BC057C4|nr:cell division protein SepF [Halodesulfurarchaeum sp.]
MGFMDRILGGENRSTGDYVELDLDDVAADAETKMELHIAEIDGQEDVIAIKDAVYDGDLVVADITRLRTEDPTVDHAIDELRETAKEVGGDIVKKGDDQILITPTGVGIRREKLNR